MTKHYIVTEAERIAICEAADILRYMCQGHGATPEEARNACSGLLSIAFVPVENASPILDATWKDESKWP